MREEGAPLPKNYLLEWGQECYQTLNNSKYAKVMGRKETKQTGPHLNSEYPVYTCIDAKQKLFEESEQQT